MHNIRQPYLVYGHFLPLSQFTVTFAMFTRHIICALRLDEITHFTTTLFHGPLGSSNGGDVHFYILSSVKASNGG